MGLVLIACILLGFGMRGAMRWFGLSPVLDWFVVAIPVLAGLVQWLMPVTKPTTKHRALVMLGSLIFSAAILWQQLEARKAHQSEMSQLPTKKDIPTAVDFAREYAKLQQQPQPVPLPSPKQPPPPDVIMRFVNRQEPLLILENKSGVIARDLKWVVALWNMNLPERDDPLPIPISTFDWLKPHSESGALDLFGSQLVKPLVKTGDRLLGSATVMCPDCPRGHTYVVSVLFGNGGWYAEDKEGTDGTLIVPSNFHREVRDRFLTQLPTMVPEKNRIPIGDYTLRPAKPFFR